ncbi:17474_t:CDS:2 [Cetraspora pellucida]|uniref:17474_t:CDS:1 n=1 Tax=Cetraspora pellucida TaxID=1433469 RepID=A0ACA9JVN5_9GLOM|nr:17474_t:CDS:2 [Cetraspora pellucida]
MNSEPDNLTKHIESFQIEPFEKTISDLNIYIDGRQFTKLEDSAEDILVHKYKWQKDHLIVFHKSFDVDSNLDENIIKEILNEFTRSSEPLSLVLKIT